MRLSQIECRMSAVASFALVTILVDDSPREDFVVRQAQVTSAEQDGVEAIAEDSAVSPAQASLFLPSGLYCRGHQQFT